MLKVEQAQLLVTDTLPRVDTREKLLHALLAVLPWEYSFGFAIEAYSSFRHFRSRVTGVPPHVRTKICTPQRDKLNFFGRRSRAYT